MKAGWFITGTDTGVGKTRVAAALIHALARTGKRALGMKPVASGCDPVDGGLRSEDARQLMAAANVQADYADVNPYAFAPAVAPHLAAREAGTAIRLQTVCDHFARLAAAADYVVVEGVGGWQVPLGHTLTVAHMAKALDLPIILVVGMRLGCLNHALLTLESVRASGLPLAGWVANGIDSQFQLFNENVASLCERLPAPLLAVIPHQPPPVSPDVTASFFNLHAVLATVPAVSG